MNQREQVEADLAITLESDFWLPVVLISPDGAIYDKNANDPEEALGGMVLFDSYIHNMAQADLGGDLVIERPLVVLRRTSLERIPLAGETWGVKIPEEPNTTANLITYIGERAPESGRSTGWIKMYLSSAEQIEGG